jgi:GNAT superfamily N-acetyltransferase
MDKFLNNDNTSDKLTKGSNIFVCENEEKLIGMAYLVPQGNPISIYPAYWYFFSIVGVHPEYRGKGIARRLTKYVLIIQDKPMKILLTYILQKKWKMADYL